MAVRTVEQVTDTLIVHARSRNIEVTNLMLLKLLYYVQAWHLVFHGAPLFANDFEAWVHGPVVPQVFRRFKQYRWNPIMDVVQPVSDAALGAHISNVLDTYGRFTANQLERLTHSEAPWIEARKGVEPDVSSHEVISKQSMRDFYSRKLNEAQRQRQRQTQA